MHPETRKLNRGMPHLPFNFAVHDHISGMLTLVQTELDH